MDITVKQEVHRLKGRGHSIIEVVQLLRQGGYNVPLWVVSQYYHSKESK